MQEGAGLGLKTKGLGSKGRSANRDDSCARWEVLGPGLAFLREEGRCGLFLFSDLGLWQENWLVH